VTPRQPSAFSLLELVVVMVLLTTAVALLMPNVSGFFRGRRLDDEARRLWALTRYAQEVAIAQAVPVAVWVDPQTGEYGLEAEPGYGFTVSPLRYGLGSGIAVATAAGVPVPPSADGRLRLVWWPDGTLAEGGADAWELSCGQRPDDIWRLARDLPLSTFSLTKGGSG
jgi:type II secretory pathway pseudopilin PulG